MTWSSLHFILLVLQWRILYCDWKSVYVWCIYLWPLVDLFIVFSTTMYSSALKQEDRGYLVAMKTQAIFIGFLSLLSWSRIIDRLRFHIQVTFVMYLRSLPVFLLMLTLTLLWSVIIFFRNEVDEYEYRLPFSETFKQSFELTMGMDVSSWLSPN